MAVRLVASRELPQPACSAEFCAVAPPRPAAAVNLLAVGTYLLADQASQTKTGCVHLYRVQKTEEGDRPSVCMEEAAEFPTTAVFDIKWRPRCEDGEHLVVAVAGADGKASILHVQDGGEGCDPGGMVVTQACAEHVGEEGTMALSLDWGHRECGDLGTLAVSTSKGELCLVKIREAVAELETSWNAHDMEAWIVTKDRFQPSLLFSGADDCKMKIWDTRQGCDFPVHVDKRSHTMGVCCLQSHPSREFTLCSGSYDEKIRVWDTRNMRAPVTMFSHDTGGGVWRVKWHPHKPELLLAACMHAGFSILQTDSAMSSIRTLVTYTAQESLAYGADWMQSDPTGTAQSDVVATCSFYDKLLHIWVPEI